jgi:hypothetical protein
MNVSFTQPLTQSCARMARMLFRPFALGKWLVLGFAALLSEGQLHKWGTRYTSHEHHGGPFVPDAGLHRVIDFLRHPVWGALVLALLAGILVVVLVLMWVNSRGRFVFLDDVVRERAAIVEPWRRFGPHGNSLFVFTLASLLVCGGALLLITLPTLPALLAAADSGEWKLVALLAIGGWVALLIPLGIVIAYFFLFLHQFVVPIMYRHDVGVLAAWGRFLGLFRQHPLEFVGFGLIYLLLAILFVAAVATIGLSTCCIGFALAATPYVGSVLLLPFEVIFRGYGPDFLAQFGPDYSVFETPAAPPAPRA